MSSPKHSAEDIAQWDQWFAIESNNLTWALVDKSDRTKVQAEEMLLS